MTELPSLVSLCFIGSCLSGIRGCQEVTVDSRQDQVTLPCVFSNVTGNVGTIRWRYVKNRKSDVEVLTLHSHGSLTYGTGYKERVTIPSIAMTGATLDISLTVKQLKQADAGRYECRVLMNVNDRSTELKMHIKLTITRRREDISCTAGKGNLTVHLPCKDCNDVSKSTLTWSKLTSENGTTWDRCIYRRLPDGTHDPECNEADMKRFSLGSKSTLVLSCPDLADEGIYSCTIESDCSKITTYVHLTVEESACKHGTILQYSTDGSTRDNATSIPALLKQPPYKEIGVGTSGVVLIVVAVIAITCFLYRNRRSKGNGTSCEQEILEAQSTPLEPTDDNERKAGIIYVDD